MYTYHWRMALILAIALIAGCCAQAATVTVTPENMQGWVIATNEVPEDNALATGAIANYGYAVAQRDPGKAWLAEDGASMGKGAFYATTDHGGWHSTPPSVWLGVDQVNGQSLAGITLNRITKLEYYAFVAQFVTILGGGATDWESWTWRGYPRNPISLQLTVESPDGSERRTLWFRPWGGYKDILTDPNYAASACRGDNCGWHTKKWYRYDAYGTTTPDTNMATRWYCPNMGPQASPGFGDDIQWPSFADMKAYQPHAIDGDTTTLGEWKLVPTSTTYAPMDGQFKSAGWDGSTSPYGTPECTGTGMPLNFQVGARKRTTHIFLEDNIAWIRDCSGFRGYVDRFTIGIDGINTTYNFEPLPNASAPKVVVMNTKAAWDEIMYRREGHRAPAQDKYLAKVIGKTAWGPIVPNNLRACMTDGFAPRDPATGFPLDHYIGWWIYWGVPVGNPQIKENPATTGDKWWSVTGILERTPVMGTTYPESQYIPMWTSSGNMTLF